MAAPQYRLSMPEPHTHLLEVEMRLPAGRGGAELVMPSWTPGSYLMREFPRNVQDFSVSSEGGEPISWNKTDKNSWRIATSATSGAVVRYRVYANELTVRTSHLDSSHAHVNGASVFMFLRGSEHEPLELQVDTPDGWRISTSLDEIGPATFRAASFDELVDSPLEIGTHEVLEWEQHGRPHAFAIWGRGHHPHDRLVEDTKKIIDTAAQMFGGLPYERYLFILHLVPGGRGGLEHRNSTVLLMGRDSFEGEQYESLLALIAHEFFHVWNVKRIRPAPLGPFDYTQENYTRNLWVAEGFTTYYTDLLLRRAGLMTEERYLERLAQSIARHQALPGRHHQTLEDSSFDAWIKFYRPDPNTPNAQISYYQKGALVALLLDMEIRRASGDERSLDDLMRLLWERYGSKEIGFPEQPEEGILRLMEEVHGGSLAEFFARYVRGTDELDFARAFEVVGLQLAEQDEPVRGAGMGGTAEAPSRPGDTSAQETRLGIRTVDAGGGRVRITHVLRGTTAYEAGVNAGDEIVALDGFRIAHDQLGGRLRAYAEGDTIHLTLFRRDELLTFEVETGPLAAPKLRLLPLDVPAAARVRAGWLNGE